MALADFLDRYKKAIAVPPSLPSVHPTISAWQEPPHPTIATAQSSTLPNEVDIAIIGSGITGASVAYTLLNGTSPETSSLRISVLEARNAVSGATGRNGGHLVSDSHILFAGVVESLGEEEARRVLHFSEANIARLKALVSELDPVDREAVELRDVVMTSAILDEELVEFVKQSVEMVERLVPDRTMHCRMISKEEGESKYHYSEILACLEQHGAAALSPYRLITAIFSLLRQNFVGRFTLETNTPVKSLDHNPDLPYSYILETPRGTLHAKKVIHCTNGYSAYLVPGLIGKLWPFRGTMSAQAPGQSFPRLGDQVSWNSVQKSKYDPVTQILTGGLYYAQQNAKTGDIWVGGEVQKLDELLTSNDSMVTTTAEENILSVLPQIWKGVEPTGNNSAVWSGIMGWTADGLPLVGKLAPAVTKRTGDGEWIAAGYNGHGMDKAWLTGEALAHAIVSGEFPESFPKAFILSEDRFQRLTSDLAVETFAKSF